jgi:adenylate cyclase class 2
MQYEVEQKFRVRDAQELLARLERHAVRWGALEVQVDRYYAHPARDFAKTDEALRIRRIGAANFVTYKGPKLDAQTKTRRELELPLAPGDAGAADFAELLEVLSFKPVAEVRKHRRNGEITWQGRSVEVALDQVDEVGSFAELEILADAAEVEAAKACLASLAGELDLNVSERHSYLELLLATRAAK